MADQRLKIVVPGDDPPQVQGSPHLDRLEPYGDVAVFLDRPATMDEQLARVEGAQVIMNTRGAVKWFRDALEQLPDLRLIATCSIGTDMVDLEAAKERGVVVCNQPGKIAPYVAEHIIGLMFAVAKRASYQTAELKAGRWGLRQNIYLRGKTIGVIGTGNTGAEVARIANTLGMRVIAWTYNPSPERARALGVEFVELDDLLRESDVVSIQVRLSDDSREMLGAREFGLMKPGAIFVNGGRGELVNTGCAGRGPELGPPRRGGPRRVRPGAPAARPPHTLVRAGRPHAPHRRPDSRRRRKPERGLRHQRHRLPGGQPPERRQPLGALERDCILLS